MYVIGFCPDELPGYLEIFDEEYSPPSNYSPEDALDEFVETHWDVLENVFDGSTGYLELYGDDDELLARMRVENGSINLNEGA